jgi:hypothetical protein
VRRAQRVVARRHAHRHDQGKETAQEGTWLWVDSHRVGDVVAAGLTMKASRRRCSRRRPALARLHFRCGRLLPRPASRVHSVPQQRRADGDATPNLLCLASTPLAPSPLRQRTHEKVENPNGGWWDAIATQGFPIGSRSRRCERRKGMERYYWWPWRAIRRGSTPVAAKPPLASPGKGKRGLSPWRNPLAWLRARRPRRARQLSARPSHPRARPRCEPAGAMRIRGGGERVRLGETSWPTRGPRLSARD